VRSAYGFGIVQAQELERAGRSTFDELCGLLSEASGITFKTAITTSYRELAIGIEEGDVGVAWLPPIPTLELESRSLGTVLGIPTRNGTTTYHSALIVRRGGPKTIAELRGRRAVWVQRESAAGYLVPRMHLAGQGIDVLRYFSRELFVHSHTAVVEAIVNGDADVGATYCHERIEGGAPRVIRGAWMDDEGRSLRPVEVLATFGPIPNDALVGSNELSASTRGAVTRWLLDPTDRARELLKSVLGASDFRVHNPSHYDSLKHMLRTARARGQDAMPSDSRTGLRVARRVT
jgi:ABC-type phosphate/phosphonate transport system substrate-binding protein